MSNTIIELQEFLNRSVVGSAFFIELSEEEASNMTLLEMRLEAIELFFKQALSTSPDEEMIAPIRDRYIEMVGKEMAILSYCIAKNLGDEILEQLKEPCWNIGFDARKKAIAIQKVCPKMRRDFNE